MALADAESGRLCEGITDKRYTYSKLTKSLGGGSINREIAQLLQLPEDFAFGEARLTINGRNEMLVENYKGILEYTPEEILIQTKASCVEIHGNALLIAYYNAEEMMIRGDICAVVYRK